MNRLTIDCLGKFARINSVWHKIIAFDMDNKVKMQIAVDSNSRQGYPLRETRYKSTTAILAEYADSEGFEWVETVNIDEIK